MTSSPGNCWTARPSKRWSSCWARRTVTSATSATRPISSAGFGLASPTLLSSNWTGRGGWRGHSREIDGGEVSVHWLIQEGRFADPGAVQRLIYAVAEAGGQAHVVRYPRDDPPALDFLSPAEPVLAFGAIEMIRALQARRLPFEP